MGYWIERPSGVSTYVPTSRNPRKRIEARRKRLLEDQPALVIKARDFLATGRLEDAKSRDFVRSLIGRIESGKKLTDAQWGGLASVVAFVEIKQEGTS